MANLSPLRWQSSLGTESGWPAAEQKPAEKCCPVQRFKRTSLRVLLLRSGEKIASRFGVPERRGVRLSAPRWAAESCADAQFKVLLRKHLSTDQNMPGPATSASLRMFSQKRPPQQLGLLFTARRMLRSRQLSTRRALTSSVVPKRLRKLLEEFLLNPSHFSNACTLSLTGQF